MTTEEYGGAYATGFGTTQRLLQRRGARKDLAEEVAQAAWTRGWERLYQLRDSRLVLPWVATIAVHMLRDDEKSRKRTRPLQSKYEPAAASSINLAAMDVKRTVQTCQARQRELLQRVYLDECSRSDVARDLGISQAALNSGLSRARYALRKKTGPPEARQQMVLPAIP